MTLKPWLATVTEDSINAIAQRLGVAQSNLNRQINGKTPMPAETVVKIARAYGVNPIPGLVEQGLISASEAADNAGLPDVIYRNDAVEALQRVSDRQLVGEVERRLKRNREARERARAQAQAQVGGVGEAQAQDQAE